MISIRKATSADLPALVEMNSKMLAWHAQRYPEHFLKNPGDQAISLEVQHYLAHHSYCHLIATIDEEPAGYILYEQQIRPANHTMLPAQRLHIHHIHVATVFRRQGAGRALMDAVNANKEDGEEIVLQTWGENGGAQSFFAAMGFVTQRIVMTRR